MLNKWTKARERVRLTGWTDCNGKYFFSTLFELILGTMKLPDNDIDIIMTTSGCRTQDGFNEIGEISDLHFDGYCAVVGNVPDLFVKYKDWYLVLVETSLLFHQRQKKIKNL
ncbi:hypothetical protein GBAR_LOCUS26397 [Geodia barretti]|uniref:Uncharacterized protein n=1 Tax=Geodia barretti TaxID=519541 RepID=A0AA35TIT2_GEOBA|nr:hypothetical protein GBAR_LOCUS26397 [Geodia barretti]